MGHEQLVILREMIGIQHEYRAVCCIGGNHHVQQRGYISLTGRYDSLVIQFGEGIAGGCLAFRMYDGPQAVDGKYIGACFLDQFFKDVIHLLSAGGVVSFGRPVGLQLFIQHMLFKRLVPLTVKLQESVGTDVFPGDAEFFLHGAHT